MYPEFFVVGGAVRDMAMGIQPQDIDYVVVGANHQWMIDQGFQQVGLGFPVFLDALGNEYALARTEKKTGVGYSGFSMEIENVSLFDDTKRRDLTLNSMVLTEDGKLIDYHGGMQDIKDRVLRHVSDSFADDPLRVLRLARFAARYNFTVAPETIELARSIVHEIDDIPKDRIWKEIRRAVKEPHFHRFVEVLNNTNAIDCSNLLCSIFFNVGNPYCTNNYDHTYTRSSEVNVSLKLRPMHANGATNMEYDLYRMNHMFWNDLNDTSKLVEFILKWRIMQTSDRTTLFFELLDTTASIRYLNCVVKTMKSTQISHDGIVGKALGDYIKQQYVKAIDNL